MRCLIRRSRHYTPKGGYTKFDTFLRSAADSVGNLAGFWACAFLKPDFIALLSGSWNDTVGGCLSISVDYDNHCILYLHTSWEMVWVESTTCCTLLYLVHMFVDVYPDESSKVLLQCEWYQSSLWYEYYVAILCFSLSIGTRALVIRIAYLFRSFAGYILDGIHILHGSILYIYHPHLSSPKRSVDQYCHGSRKLVPPREWKWRWV